MTSTGLAAFDETVHQSNRWLNALEAELHPCGREQAYRALRTVMHVLRDRLPESAVLSLSAQLPMLLRGLVLEGWRPRRGPSRIDTEAAFADEVKDRLDAGFPCDALSATRAVFGVLADRLDPGEVDKLIRVLPSGLRSLWPKDYWLG